MKSDLLLNLKIPVAVKSLNKIKSSMYSNRYGYSNYKKIFERCFRLMVPTLTRTKEKRDLMIIRHYGKGKRKLDDDNFRGGCKPIPDLLKSFGIIWDDSPQYLKADYLQIKSEDGLDWTEIKVK